MQAEPHGIPKIGQPRSTTLLWSVCDAAWGAGTTTIADPGGIHIPFSDDVTTSSAPSAPLSPVAQMMLQPNRIYASKATMRMLEQWPDGNGIVSVSAASAADNFVNETTAVKPPFSFPCLIGIALGGGHSSQMTVKEIYAYLESKFPFFKMAKMAKTAKSKSCWKNSIRHNLSLGRMFLKLPPVSGKGNNRWQIQEDWREKLFSDIRKHFGGEIVALHNRDPATPQKPGARGQAAATGKKRFSPYKKQKPTRPAFTHEQAGPTVKLSQRQQQLRQRQQEQEQEQALAEQARAAKQAQDDHDFNQRRTMAAARAAQQAGYDGANGSALTYHNEGFGRSPPSPFADPFRRPQPGNVGNAGNDQQASQVVGLLSCVAMSVGEIDALIVQLNDGDQRRLPRQGPSWDTTAMLRTTPLFGEHHVQQAFGMSMTTPMTDTVTDMFDFAMHTDGNTGFRLRT